MKSTKPTWTYDEAKQVRKHLDGLGGGSDRTWALPAFTPIRLTATPKSKLTLEKLSRLGGLTLLLDPSRGKVLGDDFADTGWASPGDLWSVATEEEVRDAFPAKLNPEQIEFVRSHSAFSPIRNLILTA